VLFDSADNIATLRDPANQAWVALIEALDGQPFEILARRYYVALYHFRKRRCRSPLPGTIELNAAGRQQALQGILAVMEQRKERSKQAGGMRAAANIFVQASTLSDDQRLPEVLRDPTVIPPPVREILGGPGRPPCDALCLMRAFLAAPLLDVGDDPTSVYRLLRSNPTFASQCGFLARGVLKQPGEWTSRRLPSLSLCAEFSEVMTRYDLWHLARLAQVRSNFAAGVVEIEDTASFDTTHIQAHSHCANVVPPDAPPVEDGKKPKHRKVPNLKKRCGCGKKQWESCEHPWSPTDAGAAVVVKGPTRVYWAHKVSVAAFANSEVPFDARVCQYAAESDGKTLVPHLELLVREMPEAVLPLRYILADDAYQENRNIVQGFGQRARLIVPVHGRKARLALAESFDGINRFTPIGVPVCEAEHRFEMRGRDITGQRYIWAAPDDGDGQPVCTGCSFTTGCLNKGRRRHIRVERQAQPQIDWDHPQHFARDRARYQRRTGVERAIKLLKVDLNAEHLTHRDALRVQAHLDRRLLTLHILLAASP
jgi:hypothetical protein